MMALGRGLCSDEDVQVGTPYLAKLGERYFVIMPLCLKGTTRTVIPYSEAGYVDPVDHQMKSFLTQKDGMEVGIDLAPIY